MAMVGLANSDFGRILFGTLFLGKLKETGEFKDARIFLWKYVYFQWMCEKLYKFIFFRIGRRQIIDEIHRNLQVRWCQKQLLAIP